MKEYELFGRLVRCKKKQINGNWYYLLVWDKPTSNGDSYNVLVFADRDGSEMDYTHPSLLYNEFDIRTAFKQKKKRFENRNADLPSVISKTINKAVCKVEKKQEDKDEFERMVDSAFEANKEVHEGIDYELDELDEL